jgi:hypothetical protein
LLVGRDVATRSSWTTFISGIIMEFQSLPWQLGVYAMVAGPLWLLSFPGVGSVIAMPPTLAWTWMFVSLSGLSRSLSRHAVPLTYPFLVVGGTRLHLALAAHDRLDSNLSADDKRVLLGRL